MTDEEIDKEISKRMNILTPYFLMVDSSLTDSQLSIIKLEAKKCYTVLYEKKNLFFTIMFCAIEQFVVCTKE